MSESTSVERWVPIPGCEGRYDVSDQGRVWSYRVGKQLEPHLVGAVGKQYRAVTIGGRHRRIHRLVLEAFVGPCPPGHEGCHGPGGSWDNRLENLRWDTRSANAMDRVRAGTHVTTARTHCPRRHELVAPNLRPLEVARGRRACLACHLAYGEARKAQRRGEVVENLYRDADDFYARILDGETFTRRATCSQGHELVNGCCRH